MRTPGIARLTAVAPVLLLAALCSCALPAQTWPSPLPSVLPAITPSPKTPGLDTLDPGGCEVHLWHSFGPGKEEVLMALAEKFAIENAWGVHLRLESHSSLHQDVLAAIEAGSPPDLVIALCEQVAEYALLGAAIPMRRYIEHSWYGLSDAEQADLWPVFLQGGCTPAGTDRPLGLLFDTSAQVMFYNVGWLEDLGMEAPPQTWEEFKEVCSAARDKNDGTWGYVHSSSGMAMINWIAGLGGGLIDPRASQAVLDGPEAVGAVSALRDLVQEGCAYCADTPGSDRQSFANEDVLVTFGATSEIAAYAEAITNPKTAKSRFEWALAPMPYLTPEPTVVVRGSTIGILRTTPRQQLAAWIFVRWLLQPQHDLQWALATGALPMHRSSLEATEMLSRLEEDPHYASAIELLPYAQAEPAVPRWSEINALLTDATATVCQGRAEPADALVAADAAADMLLGP